MRTTTGPHTRTLPTDHHLQGVERGARRDEQRRAVRSAKRQVRPGLRHGGRADRVAVGVVDGDVLVRSGRGCPGHPSSAHRRPGQRTVACRSVTRHLPACTRRCVRCRGRRRDPPTIRCAHDPIRSHQVVGHLEGTARERGGPLRCFRIVVANLPRRGGLGPAPQTTRAARGCRQGLLDRRRQRPSPSRSPGRSHLRRLLPSRRPSSSSTARRSSDRFSSTLAKLAGSDNRSSRASSDLGVANRDTSLVRSLPPQCAQRTSPSRDRTRTIAVVILRQLVQRYS